MCRTVASNRKKLNKWGHDGRGGRILYGDRFEGGVKGNRNWRSKQALEFRRSRLFVIIIRKKDMGETMSGTILIDSAVYSSIKCNVFVLC